MINGKKEVTEVKPLGLGSPYGEEEIEAVVKLLRECIETDRMISLYTPEVKEFEDKVAEYLGVKHVIAVSSCGTGLDIATQAIGIGEGDEVITTAITYQATAVCVTRMGGVPVAADVDPTTINMSVEEIEKKITPRTKAIYPMHYGGRPQDIDAIVELAEKYNLKIVEDAAHALGAVYKGKKVGSYDFISIFSLQSGKNLSTLGEGGLITTNDDELAEKMRLLRTFAVTTRKGYENAEYGHPLQKDVVEITSNYRMTPFQAVVGIVQMDKLDGFIRKRNYVAKRLNEGLKDIEGITVCAPPPEDGVHTYHLYPVLYEPSIVGASKLEFLKVLTEDFKVYPNLHYPLWYRYSIYQERGYAWNQCPVAEDLVENKLMTLPIHPKFGDAEVDFMVEAIRNAIKKVRK